MQAHAWPVPGLLDVGAYPRGADQTAAEIVDALNAAGFNCLVRDDVMRWKYTKLLMNLANAVIALCGFGRRGGGLCGSARAEGVAVLTAAGIDFASRRGGPCSAGANVLTLVPIGGRFRTGGSTRQSLARGTGSVETDWLNGEIAPLGASTACPRRSTRRCSV